jgi:hypothetical protein
MTVEKQSDTYRDLQLALHALGSLQETIRHADAKARLLLGCEGGFAVVVVQNAAVLGGAENRALLISAGVMAVVLLGSLAVGGWHLLTTIAPRLAATHAVNRFALPATRPESESLRDQRDEAWDLVSALATIARAKHLRVRRALPALIVAAVSTATILALIVIVGIAM